MNLSRRDLFTRGLGAGKDAGRDILSPTPPGGSLLRATRAAMATRFQIFAPTSEPGGQAAATAALDVVDQVESQLTIYREHSELIALNRAAALHPVHPDRRLFRLLERCEDLWRETGGAFDVTATPLLRAWGFLRRQGRVPTEQEIAEALALTGMDKVELDREEETVRFHRPGVEINANSIGKGHALDRAALSLLDRGTSNALLHGGHSSVRALGSPPWSDGWVVSILDPADASRELARVRLRDGAMGTSGLSEQHFEVEGRRYGHILDPRTGWPAVGPGLVSVFAPLASVADALATAFFIGGIELAEEYCKTHEDVGVIFVPTPEPGQPPQLVQAGAVPESLETLD